MRLITLLNHCEHFSGFVYEKARLCQHSRTIEIEMRPRRGSKPVCSGCHERGTAYDQLGLRRFEFVPVWGFIVLLLYRMRRVDCRACGVRVEQVPWATGKHQLTKAYMLFLAHWARKLSWQETAASFRSSWDKVRQAVEYVVEWGLAHRSVGPILAIGVDLCNFHPPACARHFPAAPAPAADGVQPQSPIGSQGAGTLENPVIGPVARKSTRGSSLVYNLSGLFLS